MIIKKLSLGLYEANCYILIDDVTKDTAVIDPGEKSEKLYNYLEEMKANLKYILLTHGHMDHTGAVIELRKRFNTDVCINQKEEAQIQKGEFIFGQIRETNEVITYIEDGDIFKLGNSEIKCIETPGHSPGGMCFLAENNLFSGDTLFQGSIGRTDFSGGDYNTLINSIMNKLMVLDENTEVFPGHGSKTTIKAEKFGNQFLKSW